MVKSFQAHELGTITHMRQIEGTSLLVTVAVGERNHREMKSVRTDIRVGGPQQRAGVEDLGSGQAGEED